MHTPPLRMCIRRTPTIIQVTTMGGAAVIARRGAGRRSASAATRLAATAATRTAISDTVIPIVTAVAATGITMGVAAIMEATLTTEAVVTPGAVATTMVPVGGPLPSAVAARASDPSAAPGGLPLSGAALVVFDQPVVLVATRFLSPAAAAASAVVVAALAGVEVHPAGILWADLADRRGPATSPLGKVAQDTLAGDPRS